MSTPVVVTRIQNRRGTQAQFNALYPVGYNGIGGFGSIVGYNITNFPNVLLPGELALATDSRNMYLGNVNGEFIQLGAGGGGGGAPTPLTIALPPAASFTTISALTYSATPYFSIIYDITDNTGPDWDSTGTTFSRNGVLQLTATSYFVPASPTPPFPAITPVTLTDSGTEINTVLPNSIEFQAIYDSGHTQIEIQYTHNFSGTLTFNTSTINWAPF